MRAQKNRASLGLVLHPELSASPVPSVFVTSRIGPLVPVSCRVTWTTPAGL
jgi:hypothetical protein